MNFKVNPTVLKYSVKLLAFAMFAVAVISLYQWWTSNTGLLSPFIATLTLIASPYFYLMSRTIKTEKKD